MRQKWAPVRGFEGEYKVSNTGKVYSLKSKKELYFSRSGYGGYYTVQLSSKKKGIKNKHYMVHRLVYEAFVRPLLPNEEINHVDRDRNNNNLSNLVAMDKTEHRRLHHAGRIESVQVRQQKSERMKQIWRRRKLQQQFERKEMEQKKDMVLYPV